MKTAGNFVVFGSINVGHILNLNSFLTPGKTVTGNHYQIAFGGRGTNQVVTVGRSGASTALITYTGDDDIGESVRKQLAKDNTDIAPTSVVSGESTGIALIFVNGESENAIGIHVGMNAALSSALVEAQRDRIAQVSTLLMQLGSPIEDVLTVIEITHQSKAMVALNPAPACELSGELLALADIITLSETEAEELTGIRVENNGDAVKAVRALHAKGVHTVLITSGSRGVWASVNGEGQRVPGFKAEAVNITVVRDTFNSVLITVLLEETPLPETIRFAYTVTAIAVTYKDAQPSVPWHEEIEAFLSQQG